MPALISAPVLPTSVSRAKNGASISSPTPGLTLVGRTGAEIKAGKNKYAAGRSLSETKVTTLQDNLDQLVPGLAALGFT